MFRSENQLRLLAALFVPERPSYTIGELAMATGVPQATVSREVSRLVDHGVLAEQRQGRNRFVQANWACPWAEDLQAMLAKSVGIPALLGRVLSDVAGVRRAWIFGSWAARYHGEAGPPPADLDVLVIGDVDVAGVRSACRSVEPSVGVEIQPVVLTAAEWEGGGGFAETIRSRPLVEVPLRRRSDAA